ncbi:hypothetical protein LIER_31523 [Lithospermum erythrorhizon]|uniref:Uncharacterized protein n=1 Tax=Lithospermum erythrorhizon TaxID=34254 RepID=A0AAV3RUT1_LITER
MIHVIGQHELTQPLLEPTIMGNYGGKNELTQPLLQGSVMAYTLKFFDFNTNLNSKETSSVGVRGYLGGQHLKAPKTSNKKRAQAYERNGQLASSSKKPSISKATV